MHHVTSVLVQKIQFFGQLTKIMGAIESRQKIGERVTAAKQELKDQTDLAQKQLGFWPKNSSTSKKLLSNLKDSITKRAQIPGNLLFCCWFVDRGTVSKSLLSVCQEILNPEKPNPIEYQWLSNNILNSLIWCLKSDSSKNGRFMFEELNGIVGNYADNVAKELNSIYNNLQKERRFGELTSIKDQTLINRQDNEQVGLLKNLINHVSNGNNDIDVKSNDGGTMEDDRKQFVNVYMGLTELVTVGQDLNQEYCDFMEELFKPLMDGYRMVEFRRAPLKTFDRCHAKVRLKIIVCNMYLFLD